MGSKADSHIVIYRNGNKVVAKTTVDGKTITAEANCNPADKFIFRLGSELAVSRLFYKLDELEKFQLNKPDRLNVSLCVGDRVEVINYIGDNSLIKNGMVGTIKDNKGYSTVLVEFDTFIDGHNGSNKLCKNGHGWYINIDRIKKIIDDKFEVGDRVKINEIGHSEKGSSTINVGDTGIIREIGDLGILVEFDREIDGHSGFVGEFKAKSCWYVAPTKLEKITTPTTNITPVAPFNWKKFMNNKIEYTARSYQEFIDFLEECEKRNLRWRSGHMPINSGTKYYYTANCTIGYDYGLYVSA